MTLLAAIWSLATGLFSKLLAFFAAALKWFMQLSPAGKLAIVLSFSLIMNCFLIYNHIATSKEHKAEIAFIHKSYAEKEQKEIQKAQEVHDNKQSIWDLFVQNAKKESDKEVVDLREKLKKAQVQHEKLVFVKPLPPSCVYDSDIVQHANQAIAEARSQSEILDR